MRLILASSSPRRARLLTQIGLEFETVSPDVDESRFAGEDPSQYVQRVALLKARAGMDRGAVALAGDTAVVHEGRVLGKPGHPEEARAMLRRLQGETHEVFTGLAVAWFGESEVENKSLVDMTTVRMTPMTDTEIEWYVGTGEPLDKAGAYGIGGLGGRFVERVSGSPATVSGLPVHLIDRLLVAAGHQGLTR